MASYREDLTRAMNVLIATVAKLEERIDELCDIVSLTEQHNVKTNLPALPGEMPKEEPSAEFPAKYRSSCPRCKANINPGDPSRMADRRTWHSLCAVPQGSAA